MFVKVFKMLSALCFIVVIVGTYHYSGTATQLNWWGKQSSVPSGLLAAIVMFCGIFSGSLFRQIRRKSRKTGKINILIECSNVFTSASFWTALCVSPLVFFSIFAASGDNPENSSTFPLAFENGFFCEAIFKELFAQKLREE